VVAKVWQFLQSLAEARVEGSQVLFLDVIGTVVSEFETHHRFHQGFVPRHHFLVPFFNPPYLK